jgi:hypothetical protein
MGDEIEFISDEIGIVKYSGTFDLNGMLRMMHGFLLNKNFDFYETLHKAKVPELELEWLAEKKVTEYEKWYLELKFHFYDLRQVEVDVQGEKHKMTEGRFTILFSGGTERDYQDSWDVSSSSTKARLKKFYDMITKKEWILKHASQLIKETTELRDKTTAFLGMIASY